MNEKRLKIRDVAWGCCLVGVAVACVAWSLIPELGAAPWWRVGLFAGMGMAMLGMVFLFPDVSDRDARWLILAAAVLLRFLLWPAVVSDDVNRYLWEGMLVADGENPYSAPASDVRWEERRDAIWEAMNHRDRATAYPPGIQWVMAGAAAIWPSLGVFKVLALLGDGITLWLLLGLLREHAAPLRWAGFYAFNPVVLIAFAAEAHFDSLMIACLLAAISAAHRQRRVTWLWLGLAVQIKLVCVVLLPLFLTRRLFPGLWLLGLVIVVPSVPFFAGLVEWGSGVGAFAGGGAFNAPLYSVLAGMGVPVGLVRVVGVLAFGICALSISVARWRGLGLVDSCLWMLGALLVCSPIVHFWYVCWLLPLVALRPSFAWTALSISMGGYFIAWWTLKEAGWWGFGHGVALMIWAPWLLAGWAQHRSGLRRRRALFRDEGDFRVAVVMPVLNPGPELGVLVKELRREIGDQAEVVAVNGGSDCDVGEAKVQVLESGRGRGNQIAVGIAATSAPWIAIVHSDSVPRDGWLTDLKRAAKVHPDASLFVFGQRFDRRGPGTLLLEVLNEMRVVFGGVAFGDQTMVIRRAAMEAAGGFPAQPLMEDVEASMRLAGQGRVVYLGKEWTLSARKWGGGFAGRFCMVIRLVATYQLARMKGPAHAAAVSERLYREYYPPVAAGATQGDG